MSSPTGATRRIVPKRNTRALAEAIVHLIDHPEERARLAAAGRETARQYDIAAFVRKMEQLYDVLHLESRARHRHVAETQDLAFLTRRAGA